MERHLVVLGAGISGLSAAWRAKKQFPDIPLTLLEAQKRAGGWMGSFQTERFFFERGPRTFKTSRSVPLLEMIEKLGLTQELLAADPAAHRRFIWMDGKLQPLPRLLLRPRMLLEILREWRQPISLEEESVDAFARRRFGPEVAERLFDPLVLGIFGGDSKQLSLASCFPSLKQLELESGSLSRGALKGWNRKKSKGPIDAELFSLKGGTQQLLDRLQEELGSSLQLETTVRGLRSHKEIIEIQTDSSSIQASEVISAVPPHVLAKWMETQDAECAELLSGIPLKSLHLVYLGFHTGGLIKPAFGYLIPTREKESVMGAIFDSSVFPQHNQSAQETRLTVMVREQGQTSEQVVQEALDALRRHLQIVTPPDYVETRKAFGAIPQYTLGHAERIIRLRALLQERYPRLKIVGNYLQGPSVSDSILTTHCF